MSAPTTPENSINPENSGGPANAAGPGYFANTERVGARAATAPVQPQVAGQPPVPEGAEPVTAGSAGQQVPPKVKNAIIAGGIGLAVGFGLLGFGAGYVVGHDNSSGQSQMGGPGGNGGGMPGMNGGGMGQNGAGMGATGNHRSDSRARRPTGRQVSFPTARRPPGSFPVANRVRPANRVKPARRAHRPVDRGCSPGGPCGDRSFLTTVGVGA